MAKTLVDIDPDLLVEAQRILHGSSKKDTITLALAEVVAADARRRHVERLTKLAGLDLDNPEIMQAAWA